MKIKISLIFILFIMLLTINVFAAEEYSSIQIKSNESEYVTNINLVLKEHESENLSAKVKDKRGNDVSNPSITWNSSDQSVATVDSSGKLKALKTGTTTITATCENVNDSCTVKVSAAPIFTNFSNAKFETILEGSTETLKISNVTPEDDSKNSYYLLVTSNSTEPEIKRTNHGSIDTDAYANNTLDYLLTNKDDKYLYSRKLSKYTELNQEIYLWVIQSTRLSEAYYNDNGQYVSYSTNYVVKGKKIDKAPLPQLNIILKSFSIGHWTSSNGSETDNYTHMNFNYPTNTKDRKFTIKIGKVTDTNILNKIKGNDYSGITSLLDYAKKSSAIYTQNLTTTSEAYFRSDSSLFDGRKLLEHKAYYYIYVVFDTENEKYRPVEAVTLGQAWHSSSSQNWDLWAYTDGSFNWDNLKPTYQDPTPQQQPQQQPQQPAEQPKDNSVAPTVLPAAGTAKICLIIVTLFGLGIYFYDKCNYYKGVK